MFETIYVWIVQRGIHDVIENDACEHALGVQPTKD